MQQPGAGIKFPMKGGGGGGGEGEEVKGRGRREKGGEEKRRDPLVSV